MTMLCTRYVSICPMVCSMHVDIRPLFVVSTGVLCRCSSNFWFCVACMGTLVVQVVLLRHFVMDQMYALLAALRCARDAHVGHVKAVVVLQSVTLVNAPSKFHPGVGLSHVIFQLDWAKAVDPTRHRQEPAKPTVKSASRFHAQVLPCII